MHTFKEMYSTHTAHFNMQQCIFSLHSAGQNTLAQVSFTEGKVLSTEMRQSGLFVSPHAHIFFDTLQADLRGSRPQQ